MESKNKIYKVIILLAITQLHTFFFNNSDLQINYLCLSKILTTVPSFETQVRIFEKYLETSMPLMYKIDNTQISLIM